MRTTSLRSATFLAAAAACLIFGATACDGPPGSRKMGSGTVALALQIPGNATINTVGSTISTTIGAIPAGAGYSIALSAMTTTGGTSCGGSAPFNMTAGQTTQVAVHLVCQEAPRFGSVLINGTINICPQIDALGASPAEALVGRSIGLSSSAHDSDAGPSALTYSWSASSGILTGATTPDPRFTCTAPGTATLTLTASDGDAAAGCPAVQSVTVACTAPSGNNACALSNGAGPIRHVIHIQFDNTHLNRDRAAVPSDLKQMPHLLNFIRGNGTMMANDHTILISHTAGGILSTLTGVYPDRHGQTVSNSYARILGGVGGLPVFECPSSFGYWTDQASNNTTLPNMIGPDGSNIPAPWTPFTRAGCDFGAVSTANAVLENTGTNAAGDVTKVLGSGRPSSSRPRC